VTLTAKLPGLAPVREALPNGAIILAQQTRTHPAVTVSLSVRAGSAYDPADQVGLSHFVSKVIDRSTVRYSADQLAEALDGRGVALTTSVGRHLFTVSFTCLSDDLEDVLALAADVIRQPTFPEAEVVTRRGEIITSIRQDDDNPASVATEALYERLFPNGHPYGRPIKGSIASVEALTREQLVQFHRTQFEPTGMLVVLVGDLDPRRGVDLTALAFGDWRRDPKAGVTVPRAPRGTRRSQAAIVIPNKSQADIAYGFPALARTDSSYYAASIMNNVLGQYGLGGRLGDSIRERQGMAYYAFSSLEANLADGALLVRAGVAPQNVARTIASIDEEIGRMASDGVTADELSDTKRYLIGSLPRTLETNGGIASFLQNAEVFGLGLDFDRRLPDLLEAVTRDEVQHAASQLLDPARASIVIAGPPSTLPAEPSAA
jgi:zinc protease